MTTAIEKLWPYVAPQLFTADGTAQGVVTVANSTGFKVKQQVVISATGLPDLTVKIMRFITPTSFYVGPTNPTAGQGLTGRTDISAYTVASGAFVYAQEQPKVTIRPDDIWQAVYRQEPGTTLGVEIDDEWGNPINADNPLPVSFDGTISIGQVEIKGSPSGDLLNVNADGSIDVRNSVGVFTKPYDSITATYPTTTQEVYQSRIGGIAGAVQQTATVNYTDTTKNFILNLVVT